MKLSIGPCLVVGLLVALNTFAQTLTITNDLQLWLRADAGVTTNASGAVLQWDDQTANANNALQSAETQAPLWIANALTNKPVLRFDGTDDFLDILDSESLSFTADLSTFFVVRFEDFVNYNSVWAKTVANLPAPTDIYTVPGSGIVRAYRGDGTMSNLSPSDSLPLRPNTYLVLGMAVEGNTLTHYLNNQPNGGGPVTTNTADGQTNMKIGTREDQFTRMKGDIAELLIYSRALSSTERSNVFFYLQTKYNLLNLAPAVTLSASPAGPNVTVGSTVTLTATATDPDGTIARVEFTANGAPIGTAIAPPYSVRATIDSAGAIRFAARAVDNKDGSATSAPINLTAGPVGPTTLPVNTGLALWLSADTGVTLGTGDAVVQWADQSGNANNAVQADETMSPLLITNAFNGKPVLRFDGANDFLDIPDSDSLSITGDLATFFVLKFDDFATFRSVWAKTTANLPAPTDMYALPNNGRLRLYRGNGTGTGIQFVDSAQPFTTNVLLAGWEQAGTAVTHYLNGGANGAGSITVPMTDADTSLKIGTRTDFVTRMKGDMAEILIYDRALSTADRRGVQRYLAEKYGLAATFTATNAQPTVRITGPAGPLQAPGTNTITVEATDADGAITGVQIFANGLLVATDTNAPYTATFEFPYGGEVRLAAIATDNLGVRTSATPLTHCVQGPGAPAGLVGYWPLNGDANSVLGVDGVLVNGPAPAPDRSGAVNQALAFDGSRSNRVEIPGGGGLSGAQQGTISMWIKWTGPQDGGFGGSFGAVLGRQADGVFTSDIINLNNADPAAAAVQWRHNNANAAITGNSIVGNDMWRHIAVTFTSSNSVLYVDGLADGEGTGGTLQTSTTTPLVIGAWTGGGGAYSTATIDDVAIWNRVLSPTEITDLAGEFNTPLTLLTQPDCLAVERSGGGLRLRWGSEGILQSATDIGGPWTDVNGAASPYPVPQGSTQTFYRLRSP